MKVTNLETARDQITEIKTNKYTIKEDAKKALEEGELQIEKGATIKVTFFSGAEEEQVFLNYVGDFMDKIYFTCPVFGVDIYYYENGRFTFVDRDPDIGEFTFVNRKPDNTLWELNND